MSTHHDWWRTGALVSVAILLIFALSSSAFAANGQVLANSTPRFVQNAQNLGPENPSKVINITVRLRQHNLAERDALPKQLYDPKSPLYQHWLTPAEYAARFGPTAQEGTVVKDFLVSHGLEVTSVHQNHFYVNAQGSIADVQKAFNVHINRFNVNGKTIYSNTTNASIAGPAAAFVGSVQGLHPVAMKPRSVRPVDPDTGQPFPAVPLPAAFSKPALAGPPPSLFFENQCYRGVETHTFTTGGTLPIGYYKGNRYGSPITSGAGHYPPCGYEPPAIQTAYGVTPLINAGWDGTGQGVVIVDAFGSPTAAADLAVFSSVFALPPANFSVYNPDGVPPYNSGWAGETTLDIEWAHAVAPGAAIVLMQALDNYDNHLMNAILYALENHLGNVISNSYGSWEAGNDPASMNAWNELNLQGALMGVSINFSTGDNGDFVRAVGVK